MRQMRKIALMLCMALVLTMLPVSEAKADTGVTYVTEDGVVVRVFAHKSVDIEEEDGALIIEGKEYPLEDDLPVEDNLLVTRGANIPTQGYSLRDGPNMTIQWNNLNLQHDPATKILLVVGLHIQISFIIHQTTMTLRFLLL